MPPRTEQQLVAAVQRGDRAALGELLQGYQHRLFSICIRMVGHREDAADLTQEALLRIIQHIGEYDGRSALSTWMIRIVMNLSISHLRKRRLRLAASLEAGDNDDTGDDQGASLRHQLQDTRELQPDTSVEMAEMISQMHQAMDRLDPDFKSVLILRDLQEMDYAQIGEVLALPVGTVKSRIFRARLAMRSILHVDAAAHAQASMQSAPQVGPQVSKASRLSHGPRDVAPARPAVEGGLDRV
jgi:RNA polymerase sigma-70 factor (ECF subfamily)